MISHQNALDPLAMAMAATIVAPLCYLSKSSLARAWLFTSPKGHVAVSYGQRAVTISGGTRNSSEPMIEAQFIGEGKNTTLAGQTNYSGIR